MMTQTPMAATMQMDVKDSLLTMSFVMLSACIESNTLKPADSNVIISKTPVIGVPPLPCQVAGRRNEIIVSVS